ncbi:metallophosphoesterase family protein, partial [Megamonas funiformis]
AIDDAICLADDVDCWLHAGDSIDDAGYLADVSKKPVYAVPGNIDWFSTKPKEILVEIAGKKIFLTHGHKYNVKWTTKYLYEQASKLGADIIVYGHSHVGNEEHVNDKIIINPGSVSEPRDGLDPSFMIIDINNEKINLQRIFLK